MKVSQNSTYAMFTNMRQNMASLQRELATAQGEVTNGRVADAGLLLGSGNGRRVSLLQDIQRLQVVVDTNHLAQARVDMTLTSIDAVREHGESILASLTSSLGSSTHFDVTQRAGQTALEAITGVMNTSLNGEFIFGGINSGEEPIGDFETDGAKAALDAAFLGHFGFAKTDAAAAGIDGSAMTDFLDNVVEPMFFGAGWEASFSNASDDVITARIGLTETSDASVSANETGFRGMFFAAVVTAEYFSGDLNAAATSAAAEKALAVVATASGQLADLQGRTGFLSNRIERTSDLLSARIDEITAQSDKAVAVDPFEAATRLNNLVTQIETSYTLTGRLQQMSLMRYI